MIEGNMLFENYNDYKAQSRETLRSGIGVPEWETPYNTPVNGAELWEVASDGSETLRAVFNSNQNKFIAVP